MKNENILLIIQTSDSSSVFITEELFPHDDDRIQLTYSISEGNNPLYWIDSWHNDLLKTISVMEFPHRIVAGRRDYISWWLNCRPHIVSETIKPILKSRLEAYYVTGEIKNAFVNAKFGLEFNSDCLMEWHSILEVQCDQNRLELIPDASDSWVDVKSMISIGFVGFDSLPFLKISLEMSRFQNFQGLLDTVFKMLKQEVNPMSYGAEWVLYDSYTGVVLTKLELNDVRHLGEIGVPFFDRLICYKSHKANLTVNTIYF